MLLLTESLIIPFMNKTNKRVVIFICDVFSVVISALADAAEYVFESVEFKFFLQ